MIQILHLFVKVEIVTKHYNILLSNHQKPRVYWVARSQNLQ